MWKRLLTKFMTSCNACKRRFMAVCSTLLSLNSWLPGVRVSQTKILTGSICIIWLAICLHNLFIHSICSVCISMYWLRSRGTHTHNLTDSTFWNWGNLCHNVVFPQVHPCTHAHPSLLTQLKTGALHIYSILSKYRMVWPEWSRLE